MTEITRPLLSATLEQGGTATGLWFNASGDRIVSAAGASGVLVVWDSATLTRIQSIATGPVASVCFTTGRTMLSCGMDGLLQMWDSDTGEMIAAFSAGFPLVYGTCTSTGHVVVASATVQSAKGDVFHVATYEVLQLGLRLRSLGERRLSATNHSFLNVSPDGETILTGEGPDLVVRSFSSPSAPSRTLRLLGHSSRVNSACFDRDGALIVSSADDKTIRVWNAETGVTVVAYFRSEVATQLSFSPDSLTFFGASLGLSLPTVRMWHSSGLGEDVLKIACGTPSSLCCSPTGDSVAIITEDNGVRAISVWCIPIGCRRGASRTVCLTEDQRLTVSFIDKALRVLDARTGRLLHTLLVTPCNYAAFSACYSRSGDRFATTHDCDVCVWDAMTGREVLRLQGHAGVVRSVCFSPDGRVIATAGEDKTVCSWNALTGQRRLRLTGHAATVTAVCFSPDRPRLVSASSDLTLRVWNAVTGRVIASCDGFTESPRSTRYSPDGRHIAVYCTNEFVIVRSRDLRLVARVGAPVRHAFPIDGAAAWWSSATTAVFGVPHSYNARLSTVDIAADDGRGDLLSTLDGLDIAKRVKARIAELHALRALWASDHGASQQHGASVTVLSRVVSRWCLAKYNIAAAHRRRGAVENLRRRSDALQAVLGELRNHCVRAADGPSTTERDRLRKSAGQLLQASAGTAEPLSLPLLQEAPTQSLARGQRIIDELIEELQQCAGRIRTSVMAMAAELLDDASDASAEARNIPMHDSGINDALLAADAAVERSELVDHRLQFEVIDPLGAQTVSMGRWMKAVEAETNDRRINAEAQIKACEDALDREAVRPWHLVGSTEAAAVLISDMSSLADAVHASHFAVSQARGILALPATKRDPNKQTAAEAELRGAQETLLRARLAFSSLYRAKGRYVLSHFPEYRDVMIELLPASLRQSSRDANYAVYDATMRLSDFEVVSAVGAGNDKLLHARVSEDASNDPGSRFAGIRSVAIKEVADAHAMMREAAVLLQLERQGVRGVARALCAFEEPSGASANGSRCFLVTPWYEGGTIDDWAARAAAVDRYTLLSVATELARTLEQLHDNNVVHAVLTPRNVAIEIDQQSGRQQARAHLINFGSSLVLDGDASMIATTDADPSFMTTHAFVAPELRAAAIAPSTTRTESAKLDTLIADIDLYRLDVFGFGKILQSMKLGDETVLHAPPKPSDTALAAIRNLVQCMLSENPQSRPTMAEAARELEQCFELEMCLECSICHSAARRDGAAWCAASHTYCGECTEAAVSQWAAIPANPHHVKHGGAIFCPFGDGSGGFCGLALRLAAPPSEATAAAVKRVLREVGVAERDSRLAAANSSVAKVKEVIAELFVIKCPKCDTRQAIDFTQCLALTCGGCATMFCGYCLQLAPDSQAGHAHVLTHAGDLQRHCATVAHGRGCTQPGGEALWTCEPRWRRVWYETRIRATASTVLARLPDAETRAAVARELDLV